MFDIPPSSPATASPSMASADEPRWGLGDAAAGWGIAQVSAAIALIVLAGAFGYSQQQLDDGEVSLAFTMLQLPPLWIGFIGFSVWVAARKGRGWVTDFRARVRPVDALIGIPAGLIAQYAIVPLVSLPFVWLSGTDLDELGRPARELGERATTPGTVVLLFVMVAIGAPIAEEIFFRGLLLRSIAKRFDLRWAVVGSAVVFGATHFQPLQFPALAAAGLIFAVLAVRFDRLGPAVFAHMAFNAATVVNIVWSS